MIMKAILLISVLCVGVSVTVNARQNQMNESKVPHVVKEAFTRKYPDAQIRRWKHKKDTVDS